MHQHGSRGGGAGHTGQPRVLPCTNLRHMSHCGPQWHHAYGKQVCAAGPAGHLKPRRAPEACRAPVPGAKGLLSRRRGQATPLVPLVAPAYQPTFRPLSVLLSHKAPSGCCPTRHTRHVPQGVSHKACCPTRHQVGVRCRPPFLCTQHAPAGSAMLSSENSTQGSSSVSASHRCSAVQR